MKAEQKQTSINPYYIAPEIIKQLENSKRKVFRGDQDRVFSLDGREGSGKSTLALQLAYKLDPTLTLDDVVFTGKDFAERIKTTKKYKAIVFDEGFNGLSSKSAISKANKELVRLLMECRQLNLFIFIVLPSIFLLEKYVAIFRSHALFHVYTSRADIQRRYVKIYNYRSKKNLYLLGHKYLSYSRPRIAMSYRFYGKFPPTINRERYLVKKLRAFREENKKEQSENSKFKIQRDFLIQQFYQQTKFTHKQIADVFQGCKFPLHTTIIAQACQGIPRNPTNAKS